MNSLGLPQLWRSSLGHLQSALRIRSRLLQSVRDSLSNQDRPLKMPLVPPLLVHIALNHDCLSTKSQIRQKSHEGPSGGLQTDGGGEPGAGLKARKEMDARVYARCTRLRTEGKNGLRHF